jgi:hypothetical protein
MMVQYPASEAGMLVVVGGSLLAASLILRWFLTTVVRAFRGSPKANLRTQGKSTEVATAVANSVL